MSEILDVVRRGKTRAGLLKTWLDENMPPDVLDAEITVQLLFVLSVKLNELTKGPKGMTFSARCHLAKMQSEKPLRHFALQSLARVIDLYCILARNERNHCEIAYRNHCKRLVLSGRGKMTI